MMYWLIPFMISMVLLIAMTGDMKSKSLIDAIWIIPVTRIIIGGLIPVVWLIYFICWVIWY